MNDLQAPLSSGNFSDDAHLSSANNMADMIGYRLLQQKRLTASPSQLAYAFARKLQSVDPTAKLGEIVGHADFETWRASNDIKESHLRAAFAKVRHERKLALEQSTGLKKPARRRKVIEPVVGRLAAAVENGSAPV